MKPECWMTSVDLKDAYFSIAVHKHDRTFLKSLWKGQLLECICMPNGLAEAPRNGFSGIVLQLALGTC